VRRRNAFTLIELLVIVAILAVLVSILVPSLKRARYLTRFAVCMVNLKHVGTGIGAYTSDHRGFYPDRTIINAGLGGPDSLRRGSYDDRPAMAPYMDIDHMMLCPLAPPRPDGFSLGSSTASSVLGCYELYAGYSLVFGDPDTRMRRVGDEIHYDGYSFAVLAADYERRSENMMGMWGSTHLDADGLMGQPWVRDDAGYTVAHHYNMVTMSRGLLDRNFAFTDGSVRSLMRLEMYDERTIEVPWYSSGLHPNFAYLPPKQ